MILNVIIFKNKKIDAFTVPQFDDHEPEKSALQLARSLKLNEGKSEINTFKNLEMYYFGTFDDNTGKLDLLSEPKLLLDCSKFFKQEEIIDEKVAK